MNLWEKLRASLPFYARPGPHLAKLIKKKGLPLKPDQKLKVSEVFDSGEMGGIVCAVESGKEVLVISITHLEFPEDTPYYDEIVSYQRRRRQQLMLESIRSENKVGRNDPCPCGSGKKYKHCCWV